MSQQTENGNTRKYPFRYMRLSDHTMLDKVECRQTCTECNRSRKFFCYSCLKPLDQVAQLLPSVHIPVPIDIIKHQKEIDGKSTAIHAAILCPESVRIFTYPDIPDYSTEGDGVVLIFPSATSVSVAQLFDKKVRLAKGDNYGLPKGHNMGTLLRLRLNEVDDEEAKDEFKKGEAYDWHNLPIRRAVFIDSTWNQSRGIYKDARLRQLRTVVLQHRLSQFWRHQKKSPRWYMATIEAIHQFLLEVHTNAWGLNMCYRGLDGLEIAKQFFERVPRVAADTESIEPTAPYNGQYDNLLFFFANMYDLIHRYYDHNSLIAYRRPI